MRWDTGIRQFLKRNAPIGWSAIRLSGSGRIQLRQALGPRRGAPRFSISSLKVTSGTTSPGTTWISAPGCYAWQVDGVGFSNLIVFEAVAPHGGR